MKSRSRPRLHAVVLVLAQSTISTVAWAQSTTGAIIGQAPIAPSETVLIENDSGLAREVQVDERGRFAATQLPLGTYAVSLRRDGRVLDTRRGIALRVGASTEVAFAAAAAQLDTVSVTASKSPSIDVTAVDSRTVITADELAKLPLGRSAEAIALLAPGVVNNSGGFSSTTRLPASAGAGNSLTSFGGSAATENAYYINGFNTTDPLRSYGGLQLPYGAIDQQEVYTGGYSAQYGRSDGGVINQVGKRGSDDWHYGFQVTWEPDAARSEARDDYYASGTPASAPAGRLYKPASQDTLDSTTYSAYVGGPIIQDKLFFFVDGEFAKQIGNTVNSVDEATTGPYDVKFNYRLPRWYGKLDWNITDSNILEFTSIGDQRFTSGTLFNYDYATRQRGSVANAADDTRSGGYLNSLKYTGYLSDNLTLSALYGKLKTFSYDVAGSYDPDITYVTDVINQNPALNGGTAIDNNQTVYRLNDPQRGNRTDNLRVDLSYVWSQHTFSIGIDNLNARAVNQGYQTSGPGYYWSYGQSDPNTPISSGLGVPATGGYANGAQGYYVVKNVYNTVASVASNQRAQYVEDKWQVTDNLLLSLGLRNDQFTNKNSAGQPYIIQHQPQWAPRLGFAWDKDGDASLKIFGNVGRYYLGLPLAPALNAAAGYVSTQQYFTYSGIAGDGTPTGLTTLSGPVSANNAFGQLPDARTVTAQNIKPENQDEFILGFSKQQGDWVYGAKATYRNLRNAIDDYCDVDRVLAKAASLGYSIGSTNSCYLINPGKSNTFTLVNTAGKYVSVPLSDSELGFDGLKRRYYALDLSLEHPFNGTWYGKVEYVFSRSYGNTEGQLRSDIQQSATSTSIDWDFPELMSYSNGAQNNDHKHQLKLFGYYQLAPEWLVSANLSLISGAPKNCLGYYGPDQTDPDGYGSYYHWCNGKPSPPGSNGRLPWARQVDLGVTYRPDFAEKRLALAVSVFNVFNAQAPLNESPYLDTAPNSPDPLYGTVLVRQQPRFARFTLSYDF